MKILWQAKKSKPVYRTKKRRISLGFIKRPSIKLDRRKASRFKRRISIFSPIFALLKLNFGKLFLIAGLVFCVLFIYGIFQTNVFDVKKIRIEGVQNVDRDRLTEIVSKYKNKNIYTINLTDLEKEVQDSSVYIKNVYARKNLPSSIIIEIKERYPSLVILNFDGIYLIDEENIVTSNPLSQKIDFGDDEWKVYQTNDLDNEIIKNRIIANLKEEDSEFDEENFDYENYDIAVKQKVKEEIKNEMDQAINSHFVGLEGVVNESEYAGLPRVYFFDSGNYGIDKSLNIGQISDVEKVIKYFDEIDRYSITKMSWITDFSLQVETLEGKKFIFGDNRDIDKQLNDLDVVLIELSLNGKDFTTINLQSEIIGVK